MSNITVGRYHDPDIAVSWSGWIEGTRSDGSTWITYLDEDGNPTLHWPQRNADGGVVGEPVRLG